MSTTRKQRRRRLRKNRDRRIRNRGRLVESWLQFERAMLRLQQEREREEHAP